MKIAQIAPLFESVPPRVYGGTERVVSYLTEELARQGHDVTLFASGDSKTAARLEAVVDEGLRLNAKCLDPLAHHMRLIDIVTQKATEFDVLHFHIGYLHFSMARLIGVPHLTTMHGRLDLPDVELLYQHFRDVPLVSISNDQRKPIPWANWCGTVYHGLPEELYRFQPATGSYLAFVGRISPEKRVDRAIDIALGVGMPLRIAAKIDNVDIDYFREIIAPKLNHPLVEYVGEINDAEKNEFIGNACALLFPVDWPEPFGLVMAEAFATGTPVIGFRRGSVPEVVRHGKTGYIVDTVDEAITAVENIGAINRTHCRYEFERRFSARRMASAYLALYQKVIDVTDRTPIAV